MTVNRFCSSGLQTVALASQRILAGEADIFVAGGVESISCVQNEMNKHMANEDWLLEHKPEIYWTMLQTAEKVAKRYKISREQQDRYGVDSQLKAAKARAEGKFNDEIVPHRRAHEDRGQEHRPGEHQGDDGERRTKASAPIRPTRACPTSSRRSKAG